MTPAERAFWLRANRRADALTPDLRAALLRAFEIIRTSLPEVQLARIVAAGAIDQLMAVALNEAVLDVAFRSVRDRIRSGVEKNVSYFRRDLPGQGKVNGTIAVGFDVLSPQTIEGIRQLDTKIIQSLKDDTRQVVRALVENGLRDGVNPREIARELRTVIGLAPNQQAAIDNFRRLLEAGDKEALTRALRDRRFDGAVKRGDLSADQVDRMTDAYRRRMVAFNAEANARTASLDAMKLGHRLAWEDAAAKGIVDLDQLEKSWRGVLDARERPEHLAMEGQTVPFRAKYSNGQDIPGDTDFNCRCLSIYRVKTPSKST